MMVTDLLQFVIYMSVVVESNKVSHMFATLKSWKIMGFHWQNYQLIVIISIDSRGA